MAGATACEPEWSNVLETEIAYRRPDFAILRSDSGIPRAYLNKRMKGLSEYTRLFIVYMSFAVFLAAEAAAIFFMYRHLGIL